MTDIFISYAREDREAARALAQMIEAQKFSVWWDRELVPGETFSEVIETTLDSAKAIVVLWSTVSRKSHWVRDEAAVGRDRNRLVPIALDREPPPLGFRQLHTIDLASINHDDRTRAALWTSLAALCGRSASPTPVPPAKPVQQILQEEKRQRGFMRTYWLMGFPLALGLAALVSLLGQAAETFPIRGFGVDAIFGFILASLCLGAGRLFIVIGRRLSKRKSVRYFDQPTLTAIACAAVVALLAAFVAIGRSKGQYWDSALAAVFIVIFTFPVFAFASIPIGFIKGLDRTSFENGG